MSVATGWAPSGPEKYGIDLNAARTNVTSELHAVSSPAEDAANAVLPFHPENPLLIFGLIAAVTFGFMAFSTSVKVGGAKAALSIGDAS